MPLFQIPGLDRPGQNGKCIGGLGWRGDAQVAGKQVSERLGGQVEQS